MDNFSFTSIWTRVIIYLNGIILILGSLQKTKLANKFLSWEIDLTVIDYLNGEMFIFIVLFSTMFLIVLADYHSIKKDDKINQEFKDVFALTAKGIALSWVILFVLSFLPIIILGDDYVHDSWIKYIVSLGIILGSGVFLLFIGLNIYTIKTIDYSSNFFEPFVNAIRICTIIVITLLAFYSSYLLLHPQTFWGISAMIILGGAISWGIYYILCESGVRY